MSYFYNPGNSHTPAPVRSLHPRCRSSRRSSPKLLLLSFLSLFLSSLSSVHADVRYVYDEAGRLVQVIDPAGNSAQYHYDSAGNLLSIKRATVGALTIAEFTPDRGPIGTTVTISGVGFSATASSNLVKFNGVSATVSTATPTRLVAKVPPGATTGPITVAVGAKVAPSPTPFLVTAAPFNEAPVITSFTPRIAVAGAAVAITGNNFQSTPANNLVSFHLAQATVGSSNLTRINTTVPTSATSGPIRVRTATGTALSSNDFFVVPTGYTAGNVSVAQRIALNGAPVSINTGSAGKLAMLLFDGTQGQYLGLGISAAAVTGGNARLSIKTPNGTDLLPSLTFSSATSIDLPRLPATGTYTMVIVPSALAVLQATFTLSTDSAVILPLNGPASIFSTARVGQNARYSFTGTAGQSLSLVLNENIFQGSTRIYVYSPNGAQLTLTSLFYSTGPGIVRAVDLPTLSATGVYTVFITPQGTATGSMRVTVWTDAPGPLLVNGAATPMTLPLGRNGRYTFAGTTGQHLGIGITNFVTAPPNRNVGLTIYKPDHTVLMNCGTVSHTSGGNSCDLPALPVTGTYTVWGDNGEWAVTGTLWLSADVIGTLTPNAPAKVFSTTRVGQNARYSFSGTVGQSFLLVLSGTTFPGSTRVNVYKPDGTLLTSTSLPLGGSRTVNLTNLATPGNYTVFITPQGTAIGAINTRLLTP